MKATIQERGNGFPSTGDYVPGDDGNLYEVISIGPRIMTGGYSGASNYVHATVEVSDWEEVEEGEEFPALAVLDDGDE